MKEPIRQSPQKKTETAPPKRQKDTGKLSALEAADFLGISVKTLGYMHWKALNPDRIREDQQVDWMPEPVEGSRWTNSAIYKEEDILELGRRVEATPRQVRRPRVLKRREAR